METYGSDLKGKVAMRYRDQWNNIASPAFRTMSLEADIKVYDSTLDSWNIGLIVLSDRSNAGRLKTNGANLIAAYSRKFSNYSNRYTAVTIGSSVGMSRTNANTADLWFGRQYDQTNFTIDPSLSNGETQLQPNLSHLNVDLGFRLHYHLDKKTDIYAGFAAHHLNGPSIGLIKGDQILNKKYHLFLKANKKTGSKYTHGLALAIMMQNPSQQFVPSYNIEMDFSEVDNISLNAKLGSRIVNTINGLGNDAIIISIGIKSREWYGGFAYEINTSGLSFTTRGNGAMELSMAYYLNSSN